MLSLLHLALTVVLLAIIVIDLRRHIIPDALNLALAVLAIVHLYLFVPLGLWWMFAISAVALGSIGAFLAGPYSRWRGREMLGWGDVKFFAAAGLWLPWINVWMFLLAAGVLGTIGAIIYKARTGRAETPFAPALCIALWACVVGPFVRLYLTHYF